MPRRPPSSTRADPPCPYTPLVRSGVVQALDGDRLAGQQRGAPAEARRQRDLGVALGQQRLADEVVEGAVEVAAAVEQRLAAPQLALQLDRKRTRLNSSH